MSTVVDIGGGPMPKTGTKDEVFHCSFCGKSSKQVAKLIAGPGVFICDACVGLCDGVLAGEAVKEGTRPGWARGKVDSSQLGGVSTDDLLEDLARAGAIIRPVEENVEGLVR